MSEPTAVSDAPVVNSSPAVEVQQPPVNPTPTPVPKSPTKQRLLVSAIIGILVFAGVGYYVTTVLLQFVQPVVEVPVTETQKMVPELFLTVHDMDNSQLVNNELLVSGSTLPNTTVMIFTDEDDISLQSDADGKFEGTVVVNDTANALTVTAYGENGEEKSVTLSALVQEGS